MKDISQLPADSRQQTVLQGGPPAHLPIHLIDRILRNASSASVKDQSFYMRTSALLRTASSALSQANPALTGSLATASNQSLTMFCRRLQQQDETITSIHLTNEDLQAGQLAKLAHAIAQHRASKDISMTGCSLRDDGAILMFEALIEKSSITRLDLGSNSLTTRSLPALKALISKQTELTRLDLSYNGFGEPGLRILIDSIESHPCLRHARFRHCGLRDESLQRLERLAFKGHQT